MSHVVRFSDGVLVEVAPNPTPAEPVAAKSVIDTMPQSFDAAATSMGSTMRAVAAALKVAARDAGVTAMEVELGIGFSMEGNTFITKVGGEANLTVKVTIDGFK